MAEQAFDLTDAEGKALEELKVMITEDDKYNEEDWISKADDIILIRYLRGHKMKVTESYEYLERSNSWRCTREMHNFLEEWEMSKELEVEFLKDYMPYGVTGANYLGMPVEVRKMTMVDYPGLLRIMDIDFLIRSQISSMERAWNTYPMGQGTMIFDLGIDESCKVDTRPLQSIFQMKKYISTMTKVLKKLAEEIDPNYPEAFSKILFIRPPAVFAGVLKIIKLSFSERSRSQVQILSKNYSKEELMKYVPESAIPAYLDGTSPVVLPYGGKIPEDFSIGDPVPHSDVI